MSKADAAFQGSIPQFYDRYLGPAFFEPYAHDLAQRLAREECRDLLEIACGTGIVTRRLRDALPRNTRIVATDLNRAMTEVAAKKFRQDENIEWREADASALPFDNGSFDAVTSQFGLMFVPDKDLAHREAFRVLRHDGVYLFNVWDSFETNPVTRLTHETIGSFFDHDPPRFYETPFSYHDQRKIRASLEAAGFTGVTCSVLQLSCRSESATDFAAGLVRGNPVVEAIRERGADAEKIEAAVAKAIAAAHGESPVEATMQALIWRSVRA